MNSSDFGMAPVLSTRNGAKVLYIGQKNGIVHCIKAIDGTLVWSTANSPAGLLGGHSWGISVDDTNVYAGVINYYHEPWTLNNGTVVYGGGWVALDKVTGQIVWTTANPANFDPSGDALTPTSNGRAQSSWGAGKSHCLFYSTV